ncbi:anhydro-N-acetylmuramic acid kinase [Paenibacillus thermotolerans]|uniref:anhydro-N-acetylmuramic acid kinase n=1 Tax=Paenibacillus thermotolerans TaxID=3027807 RepID=UPI0023682CA2|nr:MULTISPECIES: anhydro-N-acetylmuramic acid kinase [unclassified Paenibacillus]
MIGSYVEKESKLVVGLMSGTSLDGVDAAVVRLTGAGLNTKAELVSYTSRPYSEPVRERIKDICTIERSDVAQVCGINFYVAELFADVVREAADAAGLRMDDIDLVSSHGQTIWHIPVSSEDDAFMSRSTLQVGDISVLAKLTGKPVVGDFRPADMAVGGQGAPLAPYGDFILFRSAEKGRLLQNVGGIGNCAAIPAGARPEDVFAFDTGPGNMIIDQAVYVLSGGGRAYDEGGAWAAEGEADLALVERMMEHPYFRMPPPKSTGRELFGKAYAEEFIGTARGRGLRDADIVATATAFTAHSIAQGYKAFVFPRSKIHEVIVTGGGAHNRTLLAMLGQLLPGQRVMNSQALGFNDDAKEAVIFAILGNDFMHGAVNNLPPATGASRPTVMGKLALPM